MLAAAGGQGNVNEVCWSLLPVFHDEAFEGASQFLGRGSLHMTAKEYMCFPLNENVSRATNTSHQTYP